MVVGGFEGDATLAVEPCLEAIAAGDGREIFLFNDEGQIEPSASEGCVMLSDGET